MQLPPLLLPLLFFSAAAFAGGELRLATTSSTENSGLLDAVLPHFHQQSQCVTRVIAVGTGRALKIGENGDADLLMVHSPPDEIQFVRNQFGIRRTTFMRNDFVVVGPPEDPANLSGENSVVSAFAQLAKTQTPFVSRGDESGTHKKEQAVWRKVKERNASLDLSPRWHISAGVGMGQALLLADQKRAYALSDRATFIAFQSKTDLAVLVENDPPLDNPYSVITVNPKRHPHINIQCAMQFENWITSQAARQQIANFRFHGQQLFFPIPPIEIQIEAGANDNANPNASQNPKTNQTPKPNPNPIPKLNPIPKPNPDSATTTTAN